MMMQEFIFFRQKRKQFRQNYEESSDTNVERVVTECKSDKPKVKARKRKSSTGKKAKKHHTDVDNTNSVSQNVNEPSSILDSLQSSLLILSCKYAHRLQEQLEMKRQSLLYASVQYSRLPDEYKLPEVLEEMKCLSLNVENPELGTSPAIDDSSMGDIRYKQKNLIDNLRNQLTDLTVANDIQVEMPQVEMPQPQPELFPTGDTFKNRKKRASKTKRHSEMVHNNVSGIGDGNVNRIKRNKSKPNKHEKREGRTDENGNYILEFIYFNEKFPLSRYDDDNAMNSNNNGCYCSHCNCCNYH